MRIIDRYIVREVLLPFLIFLGIFTFILIIPFLIQYAEAFIAKGVSGTIVFRVMATLLPQALALAIPSALLVGLLVAFGRLSADREFVALQACGIGLVRLLRPVGFVCLLGWAATSYVMLVALPDANQAFREITFSIVAARAEGEIKPRVFFDSFPNLVIYARDVPASGGWNDVFIADNRPGQTPAVYLASRGRVALDRTTRTVQLVLDDGTRHSTDAGTKYEVAQFSRAVVSIDPESVFPRNGPQKEENEMTVAELRARAADLERVGGSSHNQVMAIHRKFAFPVACLVFGLIGLALGATNRRDGKLGSFVFGLAVIFAYYVPLYLGPALAKGKLLAPWAAIWLPNILLGLLGCLMLLWRARAADQPMTWRLAARIERFRTRPDRRPAAPARVAPQNPMLARILDRYVGMMYARIFALAAAGLAGMFYVSTFLDLSDKVFKAQASWQMLAAYLWFITPQYLYYVLPMAVLLAALVTIGLLTKNSELVVMKACGISLYRVALPMLAGAVVAGGALFVLDQNILGAANRRAEAIRHVMRGGAPETFDVLNRQWLTSPSGEIYHFNVFDPVSQQVRGLDVFEFAAAQRLARRTYADRATYAPQEGVWRADHGWVREFDSAGRTSGFETIESASLALAPASYFATQRPDPKFMSYVQLRDYIADLRASGFDVTEQLVALQRKLSFPFVTIIMTLIAIPFAVTTGRGGAMFGIAVGIGLAISYWVAISVFAALGSGGVVTPVLAAWAPNVLFGSGAAYLLLTVRT
jgi:LPS export ABC transporter permease LptG/LPS export ABC transporter permease LptF